MFLISGLLFSLAKDAGMKPYYKAMLLRLLLMTAITGTLHLLPTRELIKFFHRDDPEYTRLLIQSYENPDNAEYKQALEEYRQK